MAQGNNKIADTLLELQPTAVLEFFLIYPDTLNHPTVEIPIHAGSLYQESIIWQNKSYIPVAVEVEGFEQNATSQLSRPKIKLANKDFLVTSLLQSYQDLRNAKIVRKRTFVKFLDDANFEGGNPFGQADSSAELSNDTYVIGQKTAENKVYVEFELASPLDLENFEINNRRILGKYCYWQYRGEGCNYNGIPIQQSDGTPFTDIDGNYVVPNDDYSTNNPNFRWQPTKTYNKGDLSYIENNRVLVQALGGDSPPSPARNWYVAVADGVVGKRPDVNPTYWQKDGCNKKLSSCRLRFSEGERIAYETSSTTTKTYDVIDFDGDDEYNGGWSSLSTGTARTKQTDVLNAFSASSFTVALWMTPEAPQLYGGFIQTAEGHYDTEPYAFHVCSYGHDHILRYRIDGEDLEAPINIGSFAEGELGLFIMQLDYENQVLKAFYNNSLIHLRVLPDGSEFGPMSASVFGLGFNQWALPDRPGLNLSCNAKLGPCAIWSRNLTSTERERLVRIDTDNEIAPRLYDSLIGDYAPLKNDSLVAWWESEGIVSGAPGIVDSHTNGADLVCEEDYLIVEESHELSISQTLFRKESSDILPFGGFPGTDGFSYEA